jgi:hypothetical protein
MDTYHLNDVDVLINGGDRAYEFSDDGKVCTITSTHSHELDVNQYLNDGEEDIFTNDYTGRELKINEDYVEIWNNGNRAGRVSKKMIDRILMLPSIVEIHIKQVI